MGVWRERLSAWQKRWGYLSPENQIREKRQRLLDLENRLQEGARRAVTDSRHRLQLLIQSIEALSPLKRLNQGFSYVEDREGRAVTSIRQVKTETA